MTARLFRCNIINSGGAPILWIGDQLEQGEWAEESLPSKTAGRINPGQTGHYQAESGGDIPIFSSVMTGTEGWVAFSTTNLSGETEYFKVSHWLPYWAPRRGAQAEAMRFDPRTVPGSTEFDTRDTSPATVSIKRESFSPHDDIAEFQSLPWLVAWSVAQVFTVPHGDFHWHLTLTVSGTAPPPSTTIPFSSTQPPKVNSQSFRFSNPDMWRGIWDSDDGSVTAVITERDGGMLNVSITERSPGGGELNFNAIDVPISRTRLFDITRVFDAIPTLRKNRELVSKLDRGLLEVERQGGNKFEASEIITRDQRLYGQTITALERESAFVRVPEPMKFGGDYLSLPNDAVLEIYKVTADRQNLGYELRYVRPGFVPVMVVNGIDRRLHHRILLR
ncbi:hypothetical protein [Paraburkholderia dilworthii]|uniref:hypothetical protein n=1 Tax=Paraburkholderia dilworthii TaxID=948106 RepID=UPI00040584E5|nr:hypothetical protein [Paraburkholderia dilworthii]